MSDISALGLATAIAAGTVSFLSPCVLPLVPGYVSYVAGHALPHSHHEERTAQRLSALALSLCFVLGFSTVFIILGASATVLGQLLIRYQYETNIAGGIIVMTFGLFMTGVLKLPWLERDVRFHGAIRGTRPLAAYLLGLAFGFGWTPCIGPVLGAILTVSAASATVSSGIALLTAYSLGLGIPFLATAVFTGALLKRLKTMRRIGRPLQVVAGIIMMIMGLAMVTGQLSVFAWWLLNTFPGFASIG
ncbi:MAG: cytochrome c biogenesis protein CcdA [Betaproteobacteria bacterium]|nr:cytochrome c biogenesis protein CcdA [Betaproteobacteria bacterium]MDH3436177.1 cytochrome c biogenesis protein CcdA [Betaproteobacteria bacterium]